MEKQIRTSSSLRTAILTVLISYLVVSAAIRPALACSSSSDDGGDCGKCIVDRMKYDCPSCRRMLRCMAKCLWSRTPKAKCLRRCDCGSKSYPTLSDCKKCMSNCKCSCIS